MSSEGLTHLDSAGQAHMVDVRAKTETQRFAEAEAWLLLDTQSWQVFREGQNKKGDVLAAMRLAGIGATKHTHELIPLCHPLRIVQASVVIEGYPSQDLPAPIKNQRTSTAGALRICACVSAVDRTGVEMEAMTAASVAALTGYDMLKAIDRAIVMTGVRLLTKRGGKSGEFGAEPWQ